MAPELAAALEEEITVAAALGRQVLETHARDRSDSRAEIRSGIA